MRILQYLIFCSNLIKSTTFCFIALTLLSGCSQKMADVNASIEELYTSSQDVELTREAIQNVPYPSAYVSFNDERQIFVVLAFADENPATGIIQLKWISSDSALIITENGRIVKTVGLPQNNLVSINSKQLSQPVSELSSWQASYDWMPDYRYHFTATVTPEKVGSEVIESSQWKLSTQHYQELIEFDGLDTQFTNQYWIAADGQVMKSIQYTGPSMDKIEMLILKPYALPKSQ